MKLLRLLKWILIIPLLSLSTPMESKAGSWYIETGIGGSLFLGGSTFFSNTDSSGFGFSLSGTMAFNLSSELAFMQIHLGAKAPYAAAGNASLFTVHPLFRIEFPRLYFGFGATPLVYEGTGLDLSLTPRTGAIAYMGEIGILWRVVPFFHVSIDTTAQFVQTSGSLSPSPAVTVTFMMRFFIFQTEPSRSPEDYDGWRYPFGIEIWD